MADIECVFESMASRGSIYISNLQAAQSIELVRKLKIRAILSVARSGFLQHSREDVPHYLYIPAQDHEDYQLHSFFEQTYQFIEQARRETNVLVHCKVGVSRSVTIVIAYLIKKYKYSLGQVITMVLRRRNKINPNKGFLEQLQLYAEQEGIHSPLSNNYIEKLREHTHSNRKHCYSAQNQKSSYKKHLDPLASPSLGRQPRQRLQDTSKNYELICNEDLLSKTLAEIKNCRSFDQSVQKAKDIENGEKESKYQMYVRERPIRKTASLKEEPKNKRRLSIEEKISKIRDKILKKQNFSVEKSPRSKSYQAQQKQELKPSTEFSLLRPNRFNKGEEKPSNFIKSSRANTMLNSPSFLLKNEMGQKGDIFAVDLAMDATNLYANSKRIHRRMNSKLAPQPYQ